MGLHAKVARHDAEGKCLLDVTLENPTDQVALMAHLQLRRQASGARVLPVYYSQNYLSLVPHETKTLTIEAALTDLKGEKPLLTLDGWNVAVLPAAPGEVDVVLNKQAQVASWPPSNLGETSSFKALLDKVQVACGGKAAGFSADLGFEGGKTLATPGKIDVSAPGAAPEDVYHAERYDACVYTFPMKLVAAPGAYMVRLHFAETKFEQPGQRKFHVDLNGKRVLTDFDIFAEAGGKDKAVVKEFPGIAPDASGDIVVRLSNGAADKAKINGIEVLPMPPTP